MSRATLKFDGWPWKTTGHLFYATSSFVHNFVATGEFKVEFRPRNSQFGSKSTIFEPRDLEIWRMTLKNNRAPLLSNLKLCASFHYHIAAWSQLKKSPENFLLAGSTSNNPLQVFLSARGQKNCPTMTKISSDKETHNISVCTKSEAFIWFYGHKCRYMTLTYFWLQSRSKCPNWNETQTWRVTPPTACIYQVSKWDIKTCR